MNGRHSDPYRATPDEKPEHDPLETMELKAARDTLKEISALIDKWHQGAPYTSTLMDIEKVMCQGGFKK